MASFLPLERSDKVKKRLRPYNCPEYEKNILPVNLKNHTAFSTSGSLKSRTLLLLLTLKNLLIYLHIIHAAMYSFSWCLATTEVGPLEVF